MVRMSHHIYAVRTTNLCKCTTVKLKIIFKNIRFFSDVETKTILGLELTWLVLLAVSAFLVLSACFVGIAIWFCRSSNRDENNLQC